MSGVEVFEMLHRDWSLKQI